MTTRRKFTGALLATGALANFALVAGTHGPGSGNNGNPCNGHGKADQCHGNGAKADNVQPPPACPPEDAEGLTVVTGAADYLPDWPRLAFGPR